MTSAEPAAFFSYVHRDDEHDGGQIRRLRDVLLGEVRMQLGDDGFDIFLDRDDIAWGQNWRRRIEASLDAVTLLIPILTPSFFASRECRRELELFLRRERELGRDDLVLAIYYVSTPLLDRAELRDQDPLARELAARQHADWRELRFEPFTSPVVRQRLSQLAGRMRESFWSAAPPLPDAQGRRPAASSQADTARTDSADQTTAGKQTPAVRNEPPTLSVDPWGHGDHTTIGAAIMAARPGTRILVRSGLYEELLTIDKPLEIIGQGPLEDAIVRARGGNAVRFSANIGRISNLTLEQAGGNFYGVDIAQGRLELEDCDITSAGNAAVAVHDGADPRVRRNRIHDGQQGGIFVYDQGLGTFEDNDIFAHRLAGIEVKTGGNPTVRRNRIHEGQSTGILVNAQGLGTFEDNDIFAHGLAGIEVKTGGNPTVRRNRIHDGHAGGILVYEEGLGTFEDNDIFANHLAGVEVESGANPTIRRNRIHEAGQAAGIFVYGQGLGTFEDNDIVANAYAGVEVKEGGNPTVQRNRIHESHENGIFVNVQGLGTFENNEIFANRRAGIAVDEGGNPCVRRNRINRNGYEAVRVNNGGRGTFEDNDLSDNERGAWNIAPESAKHVRKSNNRE